MLLEFANKQPHKCSLIVCVTSRVALSKVKSHLTYFAFPVFVFYTVLSYRSFHMTASLVKSHTHDYHHIEYNEFSKNCFMLESRTAKKLINCVPQLHRRIRLFPSTCKNNNFTHIMSERNPSSIQTMKLDRAKTVSII